jgi:RimJ/RimL family protein N-acetyltransferase
MAEPRPIITIAGDNVALGPMRRDLIPIYHAWITNLETTQYLSEAGAAPSLDEEIAWFEGLARNPATRNFTVYALPAYQPIGTINLHAINHRHRKANMGIMIGEPDMRGRGLGTEAVELVVDYAFHALDLHSVWLTTYEFNDRARNAYLRAGFKEVGRRECRFHAGRFWDEIHMDILASEFTKSRLKNWLTAHAVAPDHRQSDGGERHEAGSPDATNS